MTCGFVINLASTEHKHSMSTGYMKMIKDRLRDISSKSIVIFIWAINQSMNLKEPFWALRKILIYYLNDIKELTTNSRYVNGTIVMGFLQYYFSIIVLKHLSHYFSTWTEYGHDCLFFTENKAVWSFPMSKPYFLLLLSFYCD